MSEDKDFVSVRECLRGRSEAFEMLVEKYQTTIFNVVLRMTDHYEESEDITQTVFVKAFQKLDTFNPQYKFFSWLYRIAVNESLNFLKQRKHLVELDESLNLISNEKTPEDQYDILETSRDIQQALMDLKTQYRTVIILKHFQNLSYREISHILGVKEKTVKSRLFTARQQLKNILLQKGI